MSHHGKRKIIDAKVQAGRGCVSSQEGILIYPKHQPHQVTVMCTRVIAFLVGNLRIPINLYLDRIAPWVKGARVDPN